MLRAVICIDHPLQNILRSDLPILEDSFSMNCLRIANLSLNPVFVIQQQPMVDSL